MRKGVYVGRFSPIHAGHERVIGEMADRVDRENSVVIIGSCSREMSMRHLFTYAERRQLILTLYPTIPVLGLPDYLTDEEWLLALDDLLRFGGIDLSTVTFFGGCAEDIDFFMAAGRQCHIVNRFDGTSPKISATEIRDALIHERSLDGMVNPLIVQTLIELFRPRWQEFQRR